MEDELTGIELISEFMSPFEDELTVLMLGDHIDTDTQDEIIIAFNNMRKSFTELPDINAELDPIKYVSLTTSELFRGVAEEIIEKEACVIFLDRELSKNALNILTNNETDVDGLDQMLIDRYLLSMGQEKFVLDLRDCDDDRIDLLMMGMDERMGEFNYILIEDMLGIWIYNIDEFTSIKFL